MIGMDILKPLVVLAGWTMVMWAWMYATRIPAMKAAKIDLNGLIGISGNGLDAMLPPRVQWVAHNYNHLHEAPTVFYAVALTLAMVGHGDGLAATTAWFYVAFRIAHSFQQALSNLAMVRFGIFVLSSIALLALIVQAALAVFTP